jgi:hypothetical protein
MLVLYNGIYLPVMKSNGNNKFSNSDVEGYSEKIRAVFEHGNDNGNYKIPSSILTPVIVEETVVVEETVAETTSNGLTAENISDITCVVNEVNLKGKSLTELQEISTTNEINIYKQGKTGKDIKKTKKELINELLLKLN